MKGGALLVVAALCLVGCIHAAYVIVAPTDIQICANSNSTTMPQIGKVKVCAKAAIQGNGFGSAKAFAFSEAKTVKMASSACGDAVANGMADLCTGKDPMATIYSMSQTCASAVAAVYSKSVSAAEVTDFSAIVDAWKKVKNTYSSSKYLMACGNSCSNAESCSHAFAQAAACGISSATDNCAAAGAYVSTKAFSKAFVQAIASSWSSACAKGLGKAQSSGEVVALATAKSIAKSFAQAAATACTSCPICKCKDLPKGYDWNDISQYADATAKTTEGKITVAKAISKAVSTYCDAKGNPKALESAAQGAVDTMAEMLISIVAKIKGSATTKGNAWACGGGSLSVTVEAVKQAYAEAVADASGAVFGNWCPGAEAKLSQLGVMNSESVTAAVNKALEACAKGNDKVDVSTLIKQELKGHNPWVSAMSEALTDAQACGCKPADCFWCEPGYGSRRR